MTIRAYRDAFDVAKDTYNTANRLQAAGKLDEAQDTYKEASAGFRRADEMAIALYRAARPADPS